MPRTLRELAVEFRVGLAITIGDELDESDARLAGIDGHGWASFYLLLGWDFGSTYRAIRMSNTLERLSSSSGDLGQHDAAAAVPHRLHEPDGGLSLGEAQQPDDPADPPWNVESRPPQNSRLASRSRGQLPSSSIMRAAASSLLMVMWPPGHTGGRGVHRERTGEATGRLLAATAEHSGRGSDAERSAFADPSLSHSGHSTLSVNPSSRYTVSSGLRPGRNSRAGDVGGGVLAERTFRPEPERAVGTHLDHCSMSVGVGFDHLDLPQRALADHRRQDDRVAAPPLVSSTQPQP